MADIKQVLASNMKLHRKKQGLSQNKLADKINTATNYIAMIELGKKFPSAQMIERIADALNVEAPDLFAAVPFQSYSMEKLCTSILSDIEMVLHERLTVLEQSNKCE
jgi:transcriptional regulator with XRE-family HTH domain